MSASIINLQTITGYIQPKVRVVFISRIVVGIVECHCYIRIVQIQVYRPSIAVCINCRRIDIRQGNHVPSISVLNVKRI